MANKPHKNKNHLPSWESRWKIKILSMKNNENTQIIMKNNKNKTVRVFSYYLSHFFIKIFFFQK